MKNIEYNFWLLEYDIIKDKRILIKCELIPNLYDVLKLKKMDEIIGIDGKQFISNETDTYTYLSKYNYISIGIPMKKGILFDLDNFNINDFDPDCILVDLYYQAINHRNYKLQKIIEVC